MVNSVSCRQIVDSHNPNAYRFRLLVVLVGTNIYIVSSVSIVVTLNASLSLVSSTLVPQKKQFFLKEIHCSALQVRERRLQVVSSETDFLARLMLLGRQYSLLSNSTLSVVMDQTARFIPSLPFSFKVTTTYSPLRLLLQITQFTVPSINCYFTSWLETKTNFQCIQTQNSWKSPSEIIGKFQHVNYQGERSIRA